ncbi:hypothetical protein QVD17_20862 [Tagetes erecta]|uniref:Uncharacterized protein n=1 Tax=Tagetes erecta TaxID=13708 RepID=A0AAD8KLZ3_TARER|nr:hypothetical protein QVD17_20862 [Tagetes erecta]
MATNNRKHQQSLIFFHKQDHLSSLQSINSLKPLIISPSVDPLDADLLLRQQKQQQQQPSIGGALLSPQLPQFEDAPDVGSSFSRRIKSSEQCPFITQ